jgi:hypothetical protein
MGQTVDLVDVDRALEGETLSPSAVIPASRGEVWIQADGDADVFRPPLARRGALVPVRDLLYVQAIHGGPRLGKPLKVELSPTDDMGFDLFAPALGLGGVGETLDMAVRDLESTVVALWSEYSSTPRNQLAPDAIALLEKLQGLFVAGE